MFRRKPINAKYVTVQRLPSFRGAHRFPEGHGGKRRGAGRKNFVRALESRAVNRLQIDD